MKLSSQNFLVTLCGAVSSVLTALLLSWLEMRWRFSFYSYMLWFVIPVGAICSGFVAAGGYYFGSILFKKKPTPMILLNMVSISIGTYFFIQYLDYISLEIDGKQVAEFLSFWKYWDITMSHSAVQFYFGRAHAKVGTPLELGSYGYWYAVLQIIGFAIGGLATYGYLSSIPWCERCRQYLSRKGSLERYTGDEETFKAFFVKTAELFEQGNLSEIISLHQNEGGAEKFDKKEHHLNTTIELKNCKQCGRHHFAFLVKKWNGSNDWKDINDLSFKTFIDSELFVSSAKRWGF